MPDSAYPVLAVDAGEPPEAEFERVFKALDGLEAEIDRRMPDPDDDLLLHSEWEGTLGVIDNIRADLRACRRNIS